MEDTARQVCGAYAETRVVGRWHSLGNHGGFSGARLWRLETAFGLFCLRAWPAGIDRARVEAVHRLQRLLQARHGFIPRLMETRTGLTCLEAGGRLWELSTWQPGASDYHQRPTPQRLGAALQCLAQMHLSLSVSQETYGVPRSISSRLVRLAEWDSIEPVISDRLLKPGARDELMSLARRACEQLRCWLRPARLALQTWANRSLPLQHCLRDVWHDHVLFEGDDVTGVVDFAAVDLDTPATDLARLIGSLVGDDAVQRQIALSAYVEVRPLGTVERGLIHLLDWTGVVVGASNWLRWLYVEGRHFDNGAGVVKRLAELVGRMEQWKQQTHGFEPWV